jgi:2,3-bisphosphoglycerate-independent phosphoglycerate mutase
LRCLLVILDGIADRPIEALGQRTPLEAASTPNLDRLAAQALTGLMDVLGPGIALSTELAHLLLFGFRLDEFPGRGPLEALGAGVPMDESSVYLSASFASVARSSGGFAIRERDLRLSDQELEELAQALESFEQGDVRVEFFPWGEGFGSLKLAGKASEHVTDSDPFWPGLPVASIQPREGFDEDPLVLATCRALNSYLLWSHKRLEECPVNDSRRAKGRPPANFLLIKWAGRLRYTPSFQDRWGMKASSIGSSPVLKGTATFAGLHFEHVETLKDPEEDMRRRMRLASGLLENFDLVHLHTKAPDDAAHLGEPQEKVRVIEALDKAMIGLEEEGLLGPEVLLAIASDHATPTEGPLVHAGDPVPVALVGRRIIPDKVSVFSERAFLEGGLGRIRGEDLMPLILNYTDRTGLYTWRSTPRSSLARPREINPLTSD